MKEIPKLPLLQELHISKSEVDDHFLSFLVTKCDELRILSLDDCNRLTDEGIQNISKLPKLEDLVLKKLPLVTGRSIHKLCNLKVLTCENCVALKDEGLCKIINDNCGLESLKLGANENVTKRLIKAAALATKARTNGVVLKINLRGFFIGVPRTEIERANLKIVFDKIETEAETKPRQPIPIHSVDGNEVGIEARTKARKSISTFSDDDDDDCYELDLDEFGYNDLDDHYDRDEVYGSNFYGSSFIIFNHDGEIFTNDPTTRDEKYQVVNRDPDHSVESPIENVDEMAFGNDPCLYGGDVK
ncbi:hypothetical protein QAD02_015549 [Eretmocerus hayati]|uniref:Uncharacterized protein n=1 Tax=Eretmocerus hayati TaxID=131215 RepID=A0ACC2P8Y8_9HYME|nr:hypothetical protein QAD02_015549 [Eretmocerus hayati]